MAGSDSLCLRKLVTYFCPHDPLFQAAQFQTPSLEAGMFQTEYPIVLALLPGPPRTHHLTSYCTVCFRPSLSPICAITVSPSWFLCLYGIFPVAMSRSASRELAKSPLQSGPSLSSKALMAHLAQEVLSFFLTWTFNGFCGLYIHPTPTLFFPGIALTGSHECHYSSRMARIEARIQILTSAFLVYFIAFHPTRQFQKHAPPLKSTRMYGAWHFLGSLHFPCIIRISFLPHTYLF